MTVRIAVVGSAPTWRRGVAAVLSDAGYEPVDFETMRDWRPGVGGSAVVVKMGGDNDVEALNHLTASHHHIPVVAVVPEVTLEDLGVLVRAGAATAVGEDDDTARLVDALRCAADASSLVPTGVLKAMAARVPGTPDAWVTDEQAGWLQDLARGTTVADIASRSGYSEREMFRTLGDLYTSIGVANRTEAIVWAARHGLVE